MKLRWIYAGFILTCLFDVDAFAQAKKQMQTPDLHIQSIEPNVVLPGQMINLVISGDNLDKVESLYLQRKGSNEQVSLIKIDLLQTSEDNHKRVVRVAIPPDANAEALEWHGKDSQRNNISTGIFFRISDALPTDVPPYIDCLTQYWLTKSQSEAAQKGIICSQSLLGYGEASDAYGKRVANRYLVVEVNVRNSNRDYEFLLDDIRMAYDELAVKGRDARIVRGIAERGAANDVRNFGLRILEGTGTLAAGLVAFPWATGDLKSAINMFQGPFISGVRSAFPDFTVSQLNRLNDQGFTVQKVIIPKNSSQTVVTFLSQEIFLTPRQRKDFKNGKFALEKDRDSDRKNLIARPNSLQQYLKVQISGGHITQVNSQEPSVRSMEPEEVQKDSRVEFRMNGTGLDKVASIRMGNASASMTSSLELARQDPTAAKSNTEITLDAGEYNVTLITRTGNEIPTGRRLIVKDAGEVEIKTFDLNKKTDTEWKIILEGNNLHQIKQISLISKDSSGQGKPIAEVAPISLNLAEGSTHFGVAMVSIKGWNNWPETGANFEVISKKGKTVDIPKQEFSLGPPQPKVIEILKPNYVVAAQPARYVFRGSDLNLVSGIEIWSGDSKKDLKSGGSGSLDNFLWELSVILHRL